MLGLVGHIGSGGEASVDGDGGQEQGGDCVRDGKRTCTVSTMQCMDVMRVSGRGSAGAGAWDTAARGCSADEAVWRYIAGRANTAHQHPP